MKCSLSTSKQSNGMGWSSAEHETILRTKSVGFDISLERPVRATKQILNSVSSYLNAPHIARRFRNTFGVFGPPGTNQKTSRSTEKLSTRTHASTTKWGSPGKWYFRFASPHKRSNESQKNEHKQNENDEKK